MVSLLFRIIGIEDIYLNLTSNLITPKVN